MLSTIKYWYYWNFIASNLEKSSSCDITGLSNLLAILWLVKYRIVAVLFPSHWPDTNWLLAGVSRIFQKFFNLAILPGWFLRDFISISPLCGFLKLEFFNNRLPRSSFSPFVLELDCAFSSDISFWCGWLNFFGNISLVWHSLAGLVHLHNSA